MMVHKINPLTDGRWPEFLDRHPLASVFHTSTWLGALKQTYRYEPVGFTTSPPGRQLENGVVFCDVKSWLTGRRLVSLPFSDHCDLLADSPDEIEGLLSFLTPVVEKGESKYIEVRPHNSFANDRLGFRPSKTFYFHSIDLRQSMESLFSNFHRSGVQRKIQRAGREGLTYEEGSSQALLNHFYTLLLLTRHRHDLPPQPMAWFRNLVDSMAEKARIRVCYKNAQPIAAMITLIFKSSMVYKYGCSDARFHNLGGMPFLFWKAIQDAKQGGILELDLGRCDCENDGLAAFKERLGAKRSLMTYWKCSAGASRGNLRWNVHLSKSLFRWMPNTLRRFTGKVLYRHLG